MKCFVIFVLAALMVAAPVRQVRGQVSQATEAAAEELIDVMLREGGEAAAGELTELGGKTAVSALLQRAAGEGGEELVDRVVQYGSRYGPSALMAIELSPSQMVRAFDRLPPDLIRPAIQAAAREPKLLSRLVSAYGNAALELAGRQPGIGPALVEKLGPDGIRIGNRLTTDQAVALARHAEDIAALPSAERNKFMDAMMKAPAQALDYLEAHPKVLLTAGGVSAFIAAKENILGSAVQSSGRGASSRGLVERVVYRLAGKFASPIIAAIVLIGVGICVFVMIKLRNMWKLSVTRRSRGRSQDAPAVCRPSKGGYHSSH